MSFLRTTLFLMSLTAACGLPEGEVTEATESAQNEAALSSASIRAFQKRLQDARAPRSPSGRIINREEVRQALSDLYFDDSQVDAQEQSAFLQWRNASSFSSSVNAAGRAYAQSFGQLYGSASGASLITVSWQNATPRLGSPNSLTNAMKVFEAVTSLAKPNAGTLQDVMQQGQATFEGVAYGSLSFVEPVSVGELRAYLGQVHSGPASQRRAEVEAVVNGLRASAGNGAELFWAPWSGASPWAPSTVLSGQALFASNASTGALTCVQFQTYTE